MVLMDRYEEQRAEEIEAEYGAEQRVEAPRLEHSQVHQVSRAAISTSSSGERSRSSNPNRAR
jgi:hypothetical protein